MKKIGILSTASIVPRFLGAANEINAENGGCEVVAVASRNLEKAREKADAWGIPNAYGSYEELIASDVDIVYVSMINSEHYKYAKMALEAGKNVFCEKPMTLSEENSAELFAIAKEKNVFLMEMQKTLFLPVIKEVKNMIDEGLLGEIKMADFSSSFRSDYNTWMNDPDKGGGAFYNNLIYSVELMQYLKGCGFVDFGGLCCKSDTGVEDQFSVSMMMEDGTLVANKTSTLVDTCHFAYIYGTKGRVEIPEYWKARKAKVYLNADGDAAESVKELEFPCKYELRYEIEHALSCIDSGLNESPIVSEKLTVESIKLINAIYNLWRK